MQLTLRLILFIAIIVYFAIVFHMLKRNQLKLRYTLLWLLFGIAMLFMNCFPQLTSNIIKATGIEVASNGVFASVLFFLIIIMIFLTSVISMMNDKIKTLTQTMAILEERMRKMEETKEYKK